MVVARHDGVRGIVAESGGAFPCSTSHVYLAAGWMVRLPEMSALEEHMLHFAYAPDPNASRRACQITVTGDLHGLLVNMPQRQV